MYKIGTINIIVSSVISITLGDLGLIRQISPITFDSELPLDIIMNNPDLIPYCYYCIIYNNRLGYPCTLRDAITICNML